MQRSFSKYLLQRHANASRLHPMPLSSLSSRLPGRADHTSSTTPIIKKKSGNRSEHSNSRSRCQHQLVAAELGNREAIREFLDSLQVATNSVMIPTGPLAAAEDDDGLPSRAVSGWEVEPSSAVEDKEKAIGENKTQLKETEFVSVESPVDASTMDTAVPAEATSFKNELNTPNTQPSKPDPLLGLTRAVRKRKTARALILLQDIFESDQQHLIPTNLLIKLFYSTVKQNPVMAYTVLRYYNEHPENQVVVGSEDHEVEDGLSFNVNLGMYRSLCKSIRSIDPQRFSRGNIHGFVESLLEELQAMNTEVQHNLYPELVCSLAEQRSVSVGPHAGVLYEYMMANDFPVTPGWLRKLLTLSKYNRQADLPYHKILANLVERNSRPHPFTTLPVIHNMFPFTNPKQMNVALKALLDFQRGDYLMDDNYNHSEVTDMYRIDFATLETISSGAAHSGNAEQIMLVWDVLEECGHKPTETIYENTVVALSCNVNCLEKAFAAMTFMEEDGFEVSRALVRSVSRAIRSNRRLLGNAVELLQNGPENMRSLGSLNCVMSAYAERGDVRDAMALLEIATLEFDVVPNHDTYSFVIEALGKEIHRRKGFDDESWVHKNVDIADSILTTMESAGVPHSSDIVRNYIELLCIANEIPTATSIVSDCLSEGRIDLINNKTIYRVAMANATAGNLDIAKQIASHTTEIIPVLLRKLRSKEQRLEHMENVRKRKK